MQLLGKRFGRSLEAMSARSLEVMSANPQPSHLFYIVNNASDLCFLVDTGAEVSVVPPSSTEQQHPQVGLTLQAVSNTTLQT